MDLSEGEGLLDTFGVMRGRQAVRDTQGTRERVSQHMVAGGRVRA